MQPAREHLVKANGDASDQSVSRNSKARDMSVHSYQGAPAIDINEDENVEGSNSSTGRNSNQAVDHGQEGSDELISPSVKQAGQGSGTVDAQEQGKLDASDDGADSDVDSIDKYSSANS